MEILNDTPLPVVCFANPRTASEPAFVAERARPLNDMTAPVDSKTDLRRDVRALRACITNFNTSAPNVDDLADFVDAEWRDLTSNGRAPMAPTR